jgi:hypothetical protein
MSSLYGSISRRPLSQCCVAALGTLFSLACQRAPSEPAAKPAAEPSAVTPPATATATPAPKPLNPLNPHGADMGRPAGSPGELAITWKDPEGWQRVQPKSPMRAAQYAVPPVAGDTEAAEVTVFHFGPQMGGGVEENISRWTGQFKGVTPETIVRTSKSANGLTHSFVQIVAGEFQGMAPMMGGAATEPKDKYGLLGVVTEAPSGKYFFKMTGPSKTVAASKAAFEQLVDSIQAK